MTETASVPCGAPTRPAGSWSAPAQAGGPARGLPSPLAKNTLPGRNQWSPAEWGQSHGIVTKQGHAVGSARFPRQGQCVVVDQRPGQAGPGLAGRQFTSPGHRSAWA